jgi:hypothetical protein
LYRSPALVGDMRLAWVTRNSHIISVENVLENAHMVDRKRKDNIKMNLRDTSCEDER